MDIKQELETKGYAVIDNVLNSIEVENAKNEFYGWKKNIPNLIRSNGIIKFYEVAHQRFAWLIKTNLNVQKYFKMLWNTDDLVVSFDGAAYVNKNCHKSDSCWVHTDQAPSKKGVHCYQGLVSLTHNTERTFVCYEGTHKLYEDYCQQYNLNHHNDWQLIDPKYLHPHVKKIKFVGLKPGSMLIWDSRLFHQNRYGVAQSEERLVQYVCYLPRNNPKNTPHSQRLRKQYFENRTVTSHWPYPIIPVEKQPSSYGYEEVIDYSKLPKPYLDDLKEEIMKII